LPSIALATLSASEERLIDMQQLPHTYSVTAAGAAAGDIALSSGGLPQIVTAPPPQFGGPGTRWSPEDLLISALASCFILTFRALARTSRLEWTHLKCDVEGTLDRIDGAMQFTHVVTRASLTVPGEADTLLCERVMQRADRNCLISNSLRCARDLSMEIVKGAAVPDREQELSCATR
jgi:peroxiredoxin-like protein